MTTPISFSAIASAQGSLLISFEGIEGAGKTTQLQKCQSWLQSVGKQVHLFREPGATELGEKLRAVILGQSAPLHPLTEAMIFAAARVELIQTKLLPLLSSPGQVVLLDRFVDSSLAYQGVARGLGIDQVLQLHAQSPLNVFPHLTIYLQIDVETSEKRQLQRGQQKDYFEKEHSSFHHKLKQGFDQVASLWPERVKAIDASGNPDQVFAQIQAQIQRLL